MRQPAAGRWIVVTSALIWLLFAINLVAQAKAKHGDYEALVARVKAGDQSVDFRQLREAYAESPNSTGGPDTSYAEKAMISALNGKRFRDAVKNADMVLATKFVDMDAHFVASVAHRELQEYQLADFHKGVFQGLLRSITESGDGKAPKTAYHVIEVHEEYVLLRTMGIGLPKSQSYLHEGGHAYDEIRFDDPETKKEQTLYFNVDIPRKHGL